MSGLDAAVEVFIDHLARELAERVDAHLNQLLAQRNREASAVDLVEAARRLGTSERDVRRMVAEGRLPSVKLGRRRRIPNSALVALLEGTDLRTPVSVPMPAGVKSITRRVEAPRGR